MLLVPEATRAQTLEALRKDWHNFQQFEQHYRGGRLFLKSFIDRSPFGIGPVRQVILTRGLPMACDAEALGLPP